MWISFTFIMWSLSLSDRKTMFSPGFATSFSMLLIGDDFITKFTLDSMCSTSMTVCPLLVVQLFIFRYCMKGSSCLTALSSLKLEKCSASYYSLLKLLFDSLSCRSVSAKQVNGFFLTSNICHFEMGSMKASGRFFQTG